MRNAQLGWMVRNIALPLLPFAVGALIRVLSTGKIDERTFSVEELAFSVAMLAMTMLASVSVLDDENLRASLNGLFAFIGIVFVAMFACVVLVNEQIIAAQGATPAGAHALLTTQNEALLRRARLIVYPAAILAVGTALYVKVRFKLGDR